MSTLAALAIGWALGVLTVLGIIALICTIPDSPPGSMEGDY